MNHLKPIFYDDFSCIGGKCPLTCCGGWNITIDDKTLKEYRLMGGKIGRFARKGVYYNKELSSNVVKLDQGQCMLLDENQLCEVVLEKGPQKLCPTCAVFPRETVISGDVEEKYLFLGCPRVVEMLFEIQEPIVFFLESDSSQDSIGSSRQDDRVLIDIKVRKTVGDFIQNKDFPFWYREFYGAYVLQKIADMTESGDFNAVLGKLLQFYSPSFCRAIYDGVKNIEVNRKQQFQSLCGIINAFMSELRSTMFADKYGCSDRIEELLKVNLDCTFDEWEEARKRWKQQKNEQQWENMLVYNWMRFAYVSQKENHLLNNYLMCVVNSLMAEHLIILYSINHEVNDLILETTIAFVSRELLHSGERVAAILKQGVDEGILSPTFLIYLCNI